MVSVREAHFNDPDFHLEEWVARYVSHVDEAQTSCREKRTA